MAIRNCTVWILVNLMEPDLDTDESQPARNGGNAAVVCLGGDKTELRQCPVPEPENGEIVLRLRVSGLCGTDLFKLKTGSATPGTVLGHEIVGDVAMVGPGVAAFREGDRVVVPHHVACGQCVLCRNGNETMCAAFKENLLDPGGFSDTIRIRARATRLAAHKIPGGLSDEKAVFVEPAACVLRGIDRSGLRDGGTALILGSGSMGLLHLQTIQAARPGARVMVVDPDRDRLTLAAELGATAVAAPGEEAADMASDLTERVGVDAIFDTVGGNNTLGDGLHMARAGGSVVLFAHAGEGDLAGFDLNGFFKREQRVIATYSGALAEQRRIFELLCAGALDPSPLVTHKMPLDEFDQGVDLTVRRKALKVLYTRSRNSRPA